MSEKRLPPVHPGEVLLEEFLKPLGNADDRILMTADKAATRCAPARGGA